MAQPRKNYWLWLWNRDDYQIALIILALDVVLVGLVPETLWPRALVIFSQVLTLGILFRYSHIRRLFSMPVIILLLASIAALSGMYLGHLISLSLVVAILALTLISLTILSMIVDLRRHLISSAQMIFGALCIYIQIGMFFVCADAISGEIFPPFFVEVLHPSFKEYLYFSFVTITTLGYGDFVPAGDLSRMLAVIEVILGQLYLVTFVALLIGNYRKTS